ncbi:hypothetical protein FHP25_05160 [Vineibacter terrae]|uniref:DUF2946 domain-containing protein n=1 Tax=Vineibacter terrae TaxID=2586908 RepID=A0A5C8PTL4_9HYPH|nr:hypothetical protein [Vineibacter terrae]TXL80419.1 hypothetical protein FHP25_05160 [Vineibacter terrae]
MFGCLRLFRVLLAWLAIVAYVAPVAAHGAASTHAHTQAPSCHDEAGDRAVSGHAPATPEVAPVDTDDTHGATPGPSAMCCVAMCAPALPSSPLISAWSPRVHVTSDSSVADGIFVAFVTRLDRPPKPGIAPIG